jgi:MFS family permease
MRDLLKDTRVQRLLVANITGSIGSGITIVAIPWLLVHRSGGDQIYGYATIGTTIALFLFMPYYGAWIDRHSRKTMLLLGELFGFVATLSMAAVAFFSGHVATWQLITSYFCGMMYFTLHYPAKYAFLQQIIDAKHFQALTGLMEIQGQAASMLSGGLAGLLADRIPLWSILLVDAATYLFSFAVQSTLPYKSTHLVEGAPTTSAWRAMAAGWRWLHAHARLSIFFGCTLVPFILVMVDNYLLPVYVKTVLLAPSTVFGGGEIAFAAGALLAGAFIPMIASRRGADSVIIATMMLCLIAISLLILLRTGAGYFVAMGIFGVGNAGCRVARTAAMLHAVPNAVMGRVGMFYNAADRLLRTLLISLSTFIVIRHSPTLAFGILWFVLCGALVGAVITRAALMRTPGSARRASA